MSFPWHGIEASQIVLAPIRLPWRSGAQQESFLHSLLATWYNQCTYKRASILHIIFNKLEVESTGARCTERVQTLGRQREHQRGQRPSLRSETHPVARQNAGTLNSSGSKSVNASKFLILSTSNLSLAFSEHSRPGDFENYNRIVVMHLICGEHPFIV
jgi:hypothetical protein